MLVLFRTFFGQFFTSESVTSDDRLRQMIIWVLAFILAPGVFLLIEVFPEYQTAVIRVRQLHWPAGLIDDYLEWIVLMLVTYSIVTVGLITTFAWDALTFDRRDALVLGSLPLRGRTIVLAKLAALGAFLLGASVVVNLLNAIMFALETSDQSGVRTLLAHFVAFGVSTIGGAAFVFATIVTLRTTLGIIAGPRLAAAVGSLLQFGFVAALLGSVLITPFVLLSRTHHLPFAMTSRIIDALPSAWFMGLFESIRYSPRRTWPEFALLSRRAVTMLSVSVVGAVAASVIAFRRQMQLALAPPASPGPLGHARLSRAVASGLVAGDPVARAIADFVLTTIARNRAQQAPIAVNAAIGLMMIALSATQMRREITPVALAVPLVMAYWICIGLRASFFLPSELVASWSFRVSASERTRSCPAAVRASVAAFAGPAALVMAAIAGWEAAGPLGAARHVAVVLVAVWLLAELIAMTVDFIPFTRPYRPGHAKLRTRWPLYLLGAYLIGPAVVRIELACRTTGAFAALLASGAAVAAIGAFGWRHRAARWSLDPTQHVAEEDDRAAVLDLGGVVPRAPIGCQR